MWMRQGYGLYSSQLHDERDRRGIEHRDAVPQDISPGRNDQMCPLVYGKGWSGIDGIYARHHQLNNILMLADQFRQGCPALTTAANILTFVFADRTMEGRPFR